MSGGRQRTGILLLVGALLILECVILLPAIAPGPHTGGDNAAYLSLAWSLLERGDLVELWDPAQPPHTKYPPVFPALLALAIAAGARSWFALKAIPAALAVLSVLLAFLWSRRRIGTPAAFAVAVLFGTSDTLLHAGSWILSEPLFLALTLGALLALDRGGARGEGKGMPRLSGAGDGPGAGAAAGAGALPAEGEAASSGSGASSGVRGAVGLPSAPFPRRAEHLRIAAGLGLVLLALFTRSAGLPLLVAAAAAQWVQGRRRAAAGVLGAWVVLGGAWALRGIRGRAPGYVSEFLLLDPYRPEMGRVGVADFAARILENAVLYLTRILPASIGGITGSVGALVGLGITALAVVGWYRALRRGGGGIPEFLVPLYLGLILIWPVVWSGDRFLLPLLPVLLTYAVEGLGRVPLPAFLRARVRSPVALLGPVLLVGLGLPALQARADRIEGVDRCAAAIRLAGPWACGGAGWTEFEGAALWAAEALPEGAAVFTRKPRIFHLLSGGVPSRVWPLSSEAGVFFRAAEEGGISYLLVDRIDGLVDRYALPLVRDHPDRFCWITGWEGTGAGAATVLLGILPPEAGTARARSPDAEDRASALAACPSRYRSGDLREPVPAPADRSAPLLFAKRP